MSATPSHSACAAGPSRRNPCPPPYAVARSSRLSVRMASTTRAIGRTSRVVARRPKGGFGGGDFPHEQPRLRSHGAARTTQRKLTFRRPGTSGCDDHTKPPAPERAPRTKRVRADVASSALHSSVFGVTCMQKAASPSLVRTRIMPSGQEVSVRSCGVGGRASGAGCTGGGASVLVGTVARGGGAGSSTRVVGAEIADCTTVVATSCGAVTGPRGRKRPHTNTAPQSDPASTRRRSLPRALGLATVAVAGSRRDTTASCSRRLAVSATDICKSRWSDPTTPDSSDCARGDPKALRKPRGESSAPEKRL